MTELMDAVDDPAEGPAPVHRRRASDRPANGPGVGGVVVAVTYAERAAIVDQFGAGVLAAVDAAVT